ncbi:MAG TPA: DHA2 family efflux MFS transporter permease subunit [Actinomycetota bacterium]|nr:DHA2 family efflux MFS transporter permease subunit [Actinomycetota bacterium]
MTSTAPALRYGTPAARWTIVATVLGSGIAFLDSTVVNVALPAIERDLDAGMSGLQWTIDSYLVALGALLLLGGSLGDLFGRRLVFVAGLVAFGVASAACALAPSVGALVAARAAQGAAAAMLVPGSLAILSASFHPDDRGRAIGAWSGLSGVTTALGPFVGGWMVDAATWRLVFLVNLPLIAIAVAIALAHVPETRDTTVARHVDVPGALTASVALAGVTYAVIEGPARSWTDPAVAGALVVGLAAAVAFIAVERRVAQPMLPLEMFASRRFTGANVTTLFVYFALGGAMFFVVLQLQNVLGYSALEAGASLFPVTLLLLALSARAGALAQRIGPRLPMTAGPLVAAAGLALMSGIEPGDSYAGGVLPGVGVFGLGLALTVAPLTSAVFAAVETRHAGVGSAVNNAVARVAGLLAVALLPLTSGVAGTDADAFAGAFPRALMTSSALCALGGLVAWLSIRGSGVDQRMPPPAVDHPCERAPAKVGA